VGNALMLSNSSRVSFFHTADMHLDSPLRLPKADPDVPAERISNKSPIDKIQLMIFGNTR
jgi:hypothetical protein